MLLQDKSLKSFNTFALEAKAHYFAQVDRMDDLYKLQNLDQWRALPKLILGGGSNILLTQDFPGLVLKISLKGIKISSENDQYVWLTVGSGENWHELVQYCVSNQYAGIENLSLIPGTVGAAPMQNIGAYGVELEKVFYELRAINLEDGKLYQFSHSQCQFGYRSSIFKRDLKNQFLITEVTLRLNKHPHFCLDYSGLKLTLEKMGVHEPNLQTISQAVCLIRQEKLPDPKKTPNAGSFFKNPTILQTLLKSLLIQHEKMPYYPTETEHTFKIPAAWLIEQCGWKGKRNGAVGVYPNHALVLVNYGGEGSGKEVQQLALDIQNSVLEKFNILLEAEVNII